MEHYEVRKLIEEEIGDFIQLKECPKCNATTPMLTWYKFDKDNNNTLLQYRCPGCLKVYVENLEEV